MLRRSRCRSCRRIRLADDDDEMMGVRLRGGESALQGIVMLESLASRTHC